MTRKKLGISGSLWSADLADLGGSIKKVERYCDSFHFDIMDGHFVQNLLFGADIVKSLRHFTEKAFEIHLMVKNPEEMLDQFIDAGGDIFIFHPQTCKSLTDTISYVKSKGKKAGIALKVEEKCEEILEYLPSIEYVIIMGTKIGIKGVSIEPDTYEKIRILRDILNKGNYNIEIQIDGGIRKETVPVLYESGADAVTAGSLLFNNDYDYIYSWFKNLKTS
ncbi:MAG: ribulose-phosphate 3-epimerase [Clostridia bacterium]|nr:ribulose-phosphate 3-epimerase [Clostridia bacterium]